MLGHQGDPGCWASEGTRRARPSTGREVLGLRPSMGLERRASVGPVKQGKSGEAPLAAPTKGKEREGVVRARCTPRPLEGKAKGKEREIEREG